MRSNQRAFTLIEILIVLTIIGILMGIALPRVGSTRRRLDVHSAKRRVAASLGQARALAIENGRAARFVRSGNTIQVWLDNGGAAPTLISSQDLSSTEGVTVRSTRDTVPFDPRGLAIGNTGGTTVVVTKGTERDSVCVIGFGKIFSDRCSLSQ